MPWAAADPAAALLEPPSLPNGLVSGEAVELEVRVARIGSRVLALLLDILVQVGLVMTLFFVAMLAISLTIAPAADPALSRLGYTLALEVARCTTPPPPPGVPGWAYLAAVLAERHRRAAHRLAIARTATAAVWPGFGAATALVAGPRRS